MTTIVIVGAGPAGVRAAECLVAAGCRPIILDENDRSGGQIYRRQPPGFVRSAQTLYGTEAAKAEALHRSFDTLAGKVDYRPGTIAWGLHAGVIHTVKAGRVDRIAFDRLILATGATDRIMPVAGWTRPGVFSMGGAQIALKFQGCVPGRRPALVGTGPLLYLLANQYLKAGVTPAGVFDTTPFRRQLRLVGGLAWDPRTLLIGLRYRLELVRWGVPVRCGIDPLAIEGDPAVTGFVYAKSGKRHVIACDGVALGHGLRSETQLAELAGVSFAFDRRTRQWLPQRDEEGRTPLGTVYLAGDGAGIGGADVAEIEGKLAAWALLHDLNAAVDDGERTRALRQLRRAARFRAALDAGFPWPHDIAARLDDGVVVCRCETLTAGELRRVAAEGAPDLGRAKALSRIGMGRCQGRYCGSACAEILSAALGCDIADVGRLRPQAPTKPLHVDDVEASL
ncbi:NAD(P)/FAD-dependent oxidoreductase [Boseaceae bacterium BT-24-1]|nr:NAD(P)/FAD-dependent oxidoreductase [Boseaceae bacterium BT-24-1]